MRVAVAQFATTFNSQENLTTCLEMINQAAHNQPTIIVLPEFCNTQPYYDDHNHAWQQALTPNSEFIQGVAQQAKQHHCYIVLNVTLRRDQTRVDKSPLDKSNISITTCILSPTGELIQQIDKADLSVQEQTYFTCAEQVPAIMADTSGKVGLLFNAQSQQYSTARKLALQGVQLLCHSEHSYTVDASSLHNVARAIDNNIFIASANKVGKFALKDRMLEHANGAGHSQIISPNGTVLAKIANDKPGVIFADIDLSTAGIANKTRPDGTKFEQQQRPTLYQNTVISRQTSVRDDEYSDQTPATINAAIFATYKSDHQAIEDVCHYIENNLSDIIQLPELFFIADKTQLISDKTQLQHAEDVSLALIKKISAVLRPYQYVCTSLVVDGKHQAVLISQIGIFATQQQLHFCQRYQWTALADEIKIIQLPLEQGNINLAMLTADDSTIPEVVHILAENNTDLLLIPFDIQSPQEVDYSLVSQGAENRVSIVAATREKSFACAQLPPHQQPEPHSKQGPIQATNQQNKKLKTKKSTGIIVNLSRNSTLTTQCQAGKFTGYANKPLVKHQHGKITKALIYPMIHNEKKLITLN